jgi:hypothetical protein
MLELFHPKVISGVQKHPKTSCPQRTAEYSLQ